MGIWGRMNTKGVITAPLPVLSVVVIAGTLRRLVGHIQTRSLTVLILSATSTITHRLSAREMKSIVLASIAVDRVERKLRMFGFSSLIGFDTSAETWIA